jgi:hypothetical protein
MKGFPSSVVQDYAFEAFYKEHGEQMPTGSSNITIATLPSGTQTSPGYLIGSIPLQVMKSYYVKEFYIGSNKNCLLSVYTGVATSNGVGSINYNVFRAFVGAGQVWRIPVDRIFTGTFETGVYFYLTQCTDTDLTNGIFGFGVVATMIADDNNFTADKKMMWIGDSIPNGTAISVDKMNSYVFGTWKYLNEKGYNVQLISKCYAGESSVGSEFMRVRGRFNVKQIDIIFYGHGINDTNTTGTGQTTQAVYQSNLDALKKWRDNRHPLIPLIILGPTSCQNTTRESLLVTLRGWASAWVATQVTAGDAHVYYCNLGSVANVPYDPTVTANYLASDAAADKVHQLETLQPAITTIITNFLTSNSIAI